METAALDPPEWLDRLVTLLIPPRAREAVIGDLHEYCATPGQYACEALCIAPFVIASQMRRNLNLPVVMVQVGLLFCGLGSGPTLVMLPLLLLWDAYQPLGRPSPHQALRGAVLVSFSGVALLLLVPLVLGQGSGRAAMRPGTGLALFLLGMPLSPLLCGVRACLMVGNDWQSAWGGTGLSVTELTALRRKFLHRARMRNLAEGALIAIAGAWGPVLMRGTPAGIALGVIYGIVAIFLFAEIPATAHLPTDFIALRARYSRELHRQQQLRRFLWWLWLAPALLALQTRAAAGHLTVMQYSVASVILCFLGTALNREGEGRMHEQIQALQSAKERLA